MQVLVCRKHGETASRSHRVRGRGPAGRAARVGEDHPGVPGHLTAVGHRTAGKLHGKRASIDLMKRPFTNDLTLFVCSMLVDVLKGVQLLSCIVRLV